MAMISVSTMMQDAVPAALPQGGRGAATSPGSGGGRFAELLQGKQPSGDQAAAPGETQAVSTPVATARQDGPQAQNSGVAPDAKVDTSRGQEASRSDATGGAATEVAGQQSPVRRSFNWQTSLVAPEAKDTTQAVEETAVSGEGGIAPGIKGGERAKIQGGIQRPGWSPEAQQAEVSLDAQQGKGAVLAMAGEAKKSQLPVQRPTKEAERSEDKDGNSAKKPTADAQESATLAASAQQGLTGMVLAAVRQPNVSGEPAASLPEVSGQGPQVGAPVPGVTPATQEANDGPALPLATAPDQNSPAGAAAATVLTAVAGNPTPGEAAAQQVEARGASATNARPAKETAQILPFPYPPHRATSREAGLDSTTGPATTTPSSAASGATGTTIKTAQKAPGMDAQALDTFRSYQGVMHDTTQNADAGDQAASPQVKAETLGKETQVPAAGGSNQGMPQAGASSGADPIQQAAVAKETNEQTSSKDSQPAADVKAAPRAAQGFHGTYAAVRGVAEQSGAKPEASPEEAGIKIASTATTAKFAPLQGAAGQDGTGDTAKREHPEQKAQDSAGTTVQPQGLGLRTDAAAEAPLPEAKGTSLKSALHESILSQVKDGVVTHDGKGNGEMSIRLNPAELGELKIQVRMDDNRVHIEVQADNRTVKDLLMSNLDSLKDSLNSKNFTMEGFDVSTGGGSFNGSLAEQKTNQQQSVPRSVRAGGYGDQGEEPRVKYLTGEVNNLLDVRF